MIIYAGAHILRYYRIDSSDDGWGVSHAPHVRVYQKDGRSRPLRHWAYHSPDGFSWGYLGSGPADLALAILANYYGERPYARSLQGGRADTFQCWRHHQWFKETVVSRFSPEGWSISSDEIFAILRRHEADLVVAQARESVRQQAEERYANENPTP